MSQPLRLLIADDSKDDVELLLHALNRGGYDATYDVVNNPDAMRAALERQDWDVITSDNAMPKFSATAALNLARELRPDVPFIILSGEMDLNVAISLMKQGAKDYIQKRELPRLVLAIERELREAEMRRAHERVDEALKISESRYRRLFETAQDGILILDADTGQITDVNPYLTEMLGYSQEEFLGKKLWEIGSFKDIPAAKLAFAELQTQGYVRYEDLPLVTSSGQRIAVEFVSNVYLVDRKNVIQCNIRNVTVRKEAEKEIRKLNVELEQRVQDRTARLEALNKDLEAFNYSVSHDLQAPLRHIGGFAEILQEDYADKLGAEGQRLIQQIRAPMQRMQALIDALLELSGISRKELERQLVDLSALATDIIASERQRGSPARQMEVVIADGVTAYGDARLLRDVLQNLLGNALKFTSRCDSARIEFGVKPAADGSAIYFVRDNGAGFDMANVNKLFGPFQRLHDFEEYPGTGIGLATVKRIIQRHGGRVWAEGAAGKGATVYFTLPSRTTPAPGPGA